MAIQLTQENYYKTLRRVSYLLKPFGLSQETEDITHWIILKRLEGKSKSQLLEHSVIDVLSMYYGFRRDDRHKKRDMMILQDTRYKYLLLGLNNDSR